MYSFGLVLWELLTGKDAFGSLENREIAIEAATNETRPVIPPCPIVLEKLMRACWAVDPASRPAFEYIGKILDKPASMLLAYATGANRAPTTDNAREAEAATAGLHQDADKLGVLVRKLITMLDSEEDFENLKAAKTLQSLAKMENTGHYFATDGGLPHLFKFIRSPGRVQEEALRALAVLAEDESVTTELARDNIFSVLLKMLAQENDIIRTIVFKVLIAAAKHHDGRDNLASLKAVGTVFDFLSGTENIQALAIDCLANLVEEHEGLRFTNPRQPVDANFGRRSVYPARTPANQQLGLADKSPESPRQHGFIKEGRERTAGQPAVRPFCQTAEQSNADASGPCVQLHGQVRSDATLTAVVGPDRSQQDFGQADRFNRPKHSHHSPANSVLLAVRQGDEAGHPRRSRACGGLYSR